ncbi:hypothetical protein [Streptomyces avidinii]|uniref:Uncharacterized protein n=1 Tax=Streptomyces avidinii TaxID=1895 RepID=A0ABS4KZ05_STRAV|nr:hypothetical protein [Streptomyces avidinii]MBP2034611.1 hypothetical protein [Streptomyces avidinii]GGY87565.1 hypothetical protein GCM10010343_10800 [Streptomyces avidinii]
MNDPITLAAKHEDDRRGTPDPIVPDEPTTPPMRTLLETAATCRPVEEVTALVSLLKEGGPLPDAGHDALRAAAVTRPVQDVRRMVALLGESPQEVAEADLTLRAAAVGRSIEDVALLVTILGKEDEAPAERQRVAEPAGPVARHAAGNPEPPEEPREEPYVPPYAVLYDAPYQEPPRRTAAVDPPAAAPSRDRALRHVLRWPVAVALLVSGALHLPNDLTALQSAVPLDYLPLLVTVLCLVSGALVALRDTAAVWRAGAATALGVVALHVLGGSLQYDPLAGALGGTLAWAGVTVMLCAAGGAVLAGLALRNHRESSA